MRRRPGRRWFDRTVLAALVVAAASPLAACGSGGSDPAGAQPAAAASPVEFSEAELTLCATVFDGLDAIQAAVDLVHGAGGFLPADVTASLHKVADAAGPVGTQADSSLRASAKDLQSSVGDIKTSYLSVDSATEMALSLRTIAIACAKFARDNGALDDGSGS